MDPFEVTLVIVGMALVTYGPRLFPLWTLAAKRLPAFLVTWLEYIPVAVLAAMLFSTIFVRDGQVSLSGDNLFVWTAIPTCLVAWKTRSLFGTVVFGMLLIAGLRLLV